MGHLVGLYIRHVLNAKHALGCTGAAASSSRSNELTRSGLRSNTALVGRRLQIYGALGRRRLQTCAAFVERRLQIYGALGRRRLQTCAAFVERRLQTFAALGGRRLQTYGALGGRRLQTYGAIGGRRLQTYAALVGRRLQTYATDDNEEHAAQNACPGRRYNCIGCRMKRLRRVFQSEGV